MRRRLQLGQEEGVRSLPCAAAGCSRLMPSLERCSECIPYHNQPQCDGWWYVTSLRPDCCFASSLMLLFRCSARDRWGSGSKCGGEDQCIPAQPPVCPPPPPQTCCTPPCLAHSCRLCVCADPLWIHCRPRGMAVEDLGQEVPVRSQGQAPEVLPRQGALVSPPVPAYWVSADGFVCFSPHSPT